MKSDGSACKMSHGVARRVEVAGVKQLVEVIDQDATQPGHCAGSAEA